MRTTPDLCGRVLDGRYRVDRVVATGGMGTVYEGFDSRLERVVAIKVMNDNLVNEPGFTERFVSEARAAARLSDPHVVAVYDRGRSADAVYLVMEYVPGRTLRQELTWGGRLPVARALDVLTGVLQGLRAAHAAGFVHDDVKPENVLITDRGAVKVTDFGLARAIEAGDHRATVLLGTAAYLAPEQFSDRAPDPRSDLYSTGILLFEMLTGHVPFRADSADDVLALHQTQRVPDPSAFVEVDDRIDALCARATEKNPADRFQSAEEMLDAVALLRRTVDPAAAAPRQLATPQPLYTAPTAAIPETVVTEHPFVIDETAPRAPDTATMAISEGDVPMPAVAVIDPPVVTPPPPGPAPRRRRRGPWVLVFLLLLVAAVGFIGWRLGTTETVSAPRLAGLTRAQALQKLESLGLRMEVSDEQYSERREKGTIISSDPAPGQRVAAQGVVSVILSRGPERYRVPDVKGMGQEQASQQLAEVNLQTGQVLQDYSRRWPQGQVMRTDPAVGTPLKRGTAVSLTISMGPQPVVVPDVTNQTADEARATLAAAGFKIKASEQFDETVPFGRVISSNPGGGTTAYRGDTIRLVVSKGSQYVAVPGVIGMDTESATAALEAEGFEVRTREQFGVTLADRVISQDPPAGTQIERGSTVTLTVT